MPAAGVSVPTAAGERHPPQVRAAAGSGWALVRLLRPRQWIKNGFVFAALIFSGRFMQVGALIDTVVAAAFFCVAASLVYVFNDLRDLDADRGHPVKRLTRPLAAGAVTVPQAKGALAVLGLGLLSGLLIDPVATGVILVYVALNVAYTMKLKEVPVVDLFSIAAGFVLRVQAGASAISLIISPWMLITTLCLALYLAAVKRRDELATSGDGNRAVLRLYTRGLLDRFAERAALSAVIFYGLFVVTVRPALAVTIPLVLFGMFRYSYVVDRAGAGESPTDVLWQDRPLAITVLAWGALSAFLLWRGWGG